MKKRVKKKHNKDLPRYKVIREIEKEAKNQFSKHFGAGIREIVKKINSDINTEPSR